MVSREDVLRMREALAHRGPDVAGLWISPDRRIGLGHRRLSIIDLGPEAAQPLCSPDGTLQIVYNGEIYNHREIRRELEAMGIGPWRTDHSDTEVILRAYETWGTDCLQRLQGMFAFALWDGKRRELWLARDRIGIKPLFHTMDGGRFRFASEIKALLAVDRRPREMDEGSFHHYLHFGFVPSPCTLFHGIRKLPPATWMRISEEGRTVQERYWDVLDHAPVLDGLTDDEIASRLLEGLRNAIRAHSLSDVPLGVFLSGGLDSSAIAALHATLHVDGTAPPVPTFTIGYEGAPPSCPDEMAHARLVAARIGADHRERSLTFRGFQDCLAGQVAAHDEPLGNPNWYPLHCLSRMARERRVPVVLGGEGSDELFLGYPWYQKAIERETHAAAGALRGPIHRMARAVQSLLPGGSRTRRRTARKDRPLFWGSKEFLGQQKAKYLLSRPMARRLAGHSIWDVIRPIHDKYISTAREKAPEHWISYVDLRLRLPESLLERIDRLSMLSGVECRVPYLDHPLVELAFGIPAAAKRRGGAKGILKRALRGTLPDTILDRRKQGLWVPIAEWSSPGWGAAMKAEILEFNREAGFFDPRPISRLDARRDATRLWYLYGLCRWHRFHIQGKG